MEIDIGAIAKIAAPIVGAFLVGTVAPRVRKAIRNRGKTEQEIASEELDRAMKRAEHAHETPEPDDDAPADEAAEAARAKLHRIRRARALWDAVADDDPRKEGER